MLGIIYIIAFFVGLIVGSFLNVVVLRWNTGRSTGGRSGCLSCNVKLLARDLVPVLSYLLLGGRCRHCRSAISMQYPLVELATGAIFVGLVHKTIFTPLPLGLLFILLLGFSILVVLVVYDIRHKILPNELVYSFAALALLARILYSPLAFWDMLAGPLFFALFALLWLVSKGTWMGFGDAKLVLGTGLLLGFTLGLASLAIAFWSGALLGLFLLLSGQRSLTMKSEIPFAPFIVAGALAAFFFDTQILAFLSSYFFLFSQ